MHRLRRQRVACITYTELAAGEIWADVGNNPLVHVSTIHSFLWLIVRMDAFLSVPASEFWGYQRYVNEESPFSTQQGIKGAQFERVLVVLDDEEGTHNQFSYDKYLGIEPLSETDLKNEAQGKDSTRDRTRRLFYVCCTRALKDLVVVLFSTNPSLAQQRVRAMNLFPDAEIYAAEALEDP